MKKNVLNACIFLLAVFLISSCVQVRDFQSSSVVPGAQGKVKVKRDGNRNYRINVDVRDLAEIKELDESKKSYVVWMDTKQGNTVNLGQLISSSGFLVSQKRASLETVSPYEPFRVYITAEHGLNPRLPGTQVVLTTESF